jgi:hypothetical protein
VDIVLGMRRLEPALQQSELVTAVGRVDDDGRAGVATRDGEDGDDGEDGEVTERSKPPLLRP